MDALGLSPDGKKLANNDEKAIRFRDVAAGRQLFEISSPRAHYSLSPDGKMLAVPTQKGVDLYDTTSGAPTGSLEGTTEQPGVLAWAPGGKTLAAVRDKTIHLWDVASGRHTADSESLRDIEYPNSACWLDEETFVLGNEHGVGVWNRSNHRTLRTIYGWGSDTAACYSPAARLAAFAGQGLIRVRSLDDGHWLYTLLSLRDDLTGVVGPQGHWQGAPGLEKEIVYVVQTEHGQETLAPQEFAKRYGWKNDPSKAVPMAGGGKKEIGGGKPEATKFRHSST